jgi:hypothetical protein
MTVIKKASVAANEQDAQELVQPNITPMPEQKQVENMTIKEIVAECESHYCCGDCKIKPLCQAYFIGEKPHKWRLYEGRH